MIRYLDAEVEGRVVPMGFEDLGSRGGNLYVSRWKVKTKPWVFTAHTTVGGNFVAADRLRSDVEQLSLQGIKFLHDIFTDLRDHP